MSWLSGFSETFRSCFLATDLVSSFVREPSGNLKKSNCFFVVANKKYDWSFKSSIPLYKLGIPNLFFLLI